jgi:hypothetical protein
LDTVKYRLYAPYNPDYAELDGWEIDLHHGPQKKLESLLQEREEKMLEALQVAKRSR